MAVHYNSRIDYRDIGEMKSGSGWYAVAFGGETIPLYINQDYDGGGWVLVLANRIGTGGMKNLTYNDAINAANYRRGTSDATNVTCLPNSASPGIALSNYNVWIGLKYWRLLTGRQVANKMTVVQFVSPTLGAALSATHTKRYRWQSDFFGPTFGFTNVAAVADETSTGSPGLYNYHAVNGFSLTTFDKDMDTYGTNCATLYNNNPWWYGNCWSGNYFAGGGYSDQPYWDSSGGDVHNYGAVYIK